MQREVDRLLSISFLQVLSYYKIDYPRNREGFLISCPFHLESHPSFYVKGGYAYCFGCSKNWGTIEFIRDKEGCGFFEALKILAGIGGLDLNEEILKRVWKDFRFSQRKAKQEGSSEGYKKLALKLASKFSDFYFSLSNWRKFIPVIDYFWLEFDTLFEGEITHMDLDKIKDWFFTSKRTLESLDKQWNLLPVLRRETREERVGKLDQ